MGLPYTFKARASRAQEQSEWVFPTGLTHVPTIDNFKCVHVNSNHPRGCADSEQYNSYAQESSAKNLTFTGFLYYVCVMADPASFPTTMLHLGLRTTCPPSHPSHPTPCITQPSCQPSCVLLASPLHPHIPPKYSDPISQLQSQSLSQLIPYT